MENKLNPEKTFSTRTDSARVPAQTSRVFLQAQKWKQRVLWKGRQFPFKVLSSVRKGGSPLR